MNIIYYPPWMRINPYIGGIITGYIYNKIYNKIK